MIRYSYFNMYARSGVFLITLDSDAREFWRATGIKMVKFIRGWISPEHETAGLKSIASTSWRSDRKSKEIATSKQKRKSVQKTSENVKPENKNDSNSNFPSPSSKVSVQNHRVPLITPRDHEESPGF